MTKILIKKENDKIIKKTIDTKNNKKKNLKDIQVFDFLNPTNKHYSIRGIWKCVCVCVLCVCIVKIIGEQN